ncbi:MAG: ATP-binding protein [Verrucomicrobiales bacterium]|nr:ATP-binding protein [Verrucomicrobiales bacterium]
MKSIRTRLMVGIGVVVGLGLTTFSIAFFNQVVLWMREDLNEKLTNRAIAFAFAVNPRRPIYEAHFDRGFRPEVSGTLYLLYDTNGTVIGKSTGVSVPFGLSQLAREQTHPFARPLKEEITLPGGIPFQVATYPVFIREDGPTRTPKGDDPTQFIPTDRTITAWAQVGTAIGGLHDRVLRLRLWLTLASVVFFGSVMACVYYLTGQWLRSLSLATETAERLSNSEIGQLRLITPSDEPEINRLTQALNGILDRLNESHNAQQRMVADASHELRTPLTILRGEIQVALRRERSIDRYQAVLASNHDEIVRLCRIVENLLTLAHADAGEVLVKQERVKVEVLVSMVCAKLSPLADPHQVRLRTELQEGLIVLGDPLALESALTNLIENAIRHSMPDEEVQVRAAAQEEEVVVEVIDGGAGIAPEHLPRLFERFYRVDKARSRQLGGAGLGLAIVKMLVEAHGGTVGVKSTIGTGSTFTIRLPTAPP